MTLPSRNKNFDLYKDNLTLRNARARELRLDEVVKFISNGYRVLIKRSEEGFCLELTSEASKAKLQYRLTAHDLEYLEDKLSQRLLV